MLFSVMWLISPPYSETAAFNTPCQARRLDGVSQVVAAYPDYPDKRIMQVDLGKDRGLLPLTRTEQECLRQCAKGMTDAQIGVGLQLSEGEVASVLSVVMLKLRVPNRMAGLAKAARLGYLEADNC